MCRGGAGPEAARRFGLAARRTRRAALALGAGGELGLRFEHRESMGPVEVALGGELVLSGTGYLATFEHVREGGSLGGAGSLFVDGFIRERCSPAVRGRSARSPSGRQTIVSAFSGSPSGRRACTPASWGIGLEVGARVEAGIRGPIALRCMAACA